MIKPRWLARSLNFTPEAVVTALYNGLLKREPDQTGFDQIVGHLRNGIPLAEIVAGFLSSPEYSCKAAGVVSAGHLDTLPANEIQLDLSAEERRELWNHVGRRWSRLGAGDPYWSVLSSDEMMIDKMSPDRIEQFYALGEPDIERMLKYFARHGQALPSNGVIVDYGCGLGRTTLWLARHCRKVVAIDVSAPHLELARENLAARGVTNVDFHLVKNATDLDILENFDLFHSILVLQHNPPPLIVEILTKMFSGMNTGGHAFFQVPTYWLYYRWNLADYLAETVPQQLMEMHFLPQSAVFDLAARSGSVLFEVQPDSATGVREAISNTFFFAKRG
jgi:SAM-dependent methyltransferase